MVNKKTILRSIKSLEEQKKIHEEKIRKEKRKYPNNPVIEYWEKQIKRFEEDINKAKERIRKSHF